MAHREKTNENEAYGDFTGRGCSRQEVNVRVGVQVRVMVWVRVGVQARVRVMVRVGVQVWVRVGVQVRVRVGVPYKHGKSADKLTYR